MRINLKFISSFVALSFFISCATKSEPDINVGKETHDLSYEKICTLKENISLFGNIESFDFIDSNHIVVATSKPSSVIIFNINGQQVKEIGDSGRGAFEYQKPKIVKVHNNKIFIWDAGQLKLLVFDKEGNSIAEHTGFKQAVNDIALSKNLVCLYFGGGYSGLLGVYDLTAKKFIFKGGQTTEEHHLLNLNTGAGGMTLFKEGLIYMTADQLALSIIDLNNFQEKDLISLYDFEFTVENVKNAQNLINSNINKAIEYLYKNSYITGLYIVEDKIMIKAEVGEFKKTENDFNDNSNRFNKYYFLNDRLELVKIVKSPHNFDEKNKLFATHKNELYSLKFNTMNEEFNYELNKLNFNEAIGK